MIDRFGKPIVIGWHDHELLYIYAALTLPKAERIAAYPDIAAMTGRTIRQVQSKCFAVTYDRQEAALERMRDKPRQVKRVEAVAASSIRPLTVAERMKGRATYSPTTGM